MYSLKSIVALSLLICCWSLLVDIRPSFAMPIEGGKQITCLLFLFLKHTLFVLVDKQLTIALTHFSLSLL